MKEQIIQSEWRLLEAIKNSDITALDDLLHDDLLFNLPNGQTITKNDDLETYRSGHIRIESIVSGNEIINVIDDIAIVAVEINLEGKYQEHVIDGKFKYIRVWKIFGGKWKIIAGSCIQL